MNEADKAWENEKEIFGKKQEGQGKDDNEKDPSTGGNEGGTGTGDSETGKPGTGDEELPPLDKTEPEEEGGSAAVTVIIVLLVFGIIGALGYIIRKMNKDDKETETDPYGNSGKYGGGMNSDGLMGLPDPDTQQYGGSYNGRDDSVDSEHILPGVGDTPKYGINA